MRWTASTAMLLLGFSLAGCKGAAYQPYTGPEKPAAAEQPTPPPQDANTQPPETQPEVKSPPEVAHVDAADVGKNVKASIRLTSRSFANGKPIPPMFTCDGFDGAPDLAWTGVPRGTASLAIIMVDPKGRNGVFTHWTLFNIKPSLTSLAAGQVPRGAAQGDNDFNQTGYGGPCPPYTDKAHRYEFTIYALKAELALTEGAPPDEVRDQINAVAIAKGRLRGTYRRRS